MSTPSTTHRYRIVVRDECADLLAGLFEGLTIESGAGWTSVEATVRDESELYGLLDRFEALALHIVSLNDLGLPHLTRQPHSS
ncbi:MAG TPA: hypothetical protein DHU96_11675 [Actinobacteria bacterium]|nr:hypothetical protein [Actinomycetota bacterium]